MDKFLKPVEIAELAATPGNPASGYQKIYPKSNGKFYQLNSAGVETEVTNVAGGISESQALAISSLRF
jgi:hypothetical protein